MGVLTEAQERLYHEQGYLLVSGLIPDAVSAAAEAAMWRSLGADPDDRSTWPTAAQFNLHEPAELSACYNQDILAAAAQLSGEPFDSSFAAPQKGFAINVFPQEGEWRWPAPHIDHAIKEHAHRTFPRPFRVASMLFLSDVPKHGAGTVVWPGSHRTILELAKRDPVRFETMWALNQELGAMALNEPVELMPRRGDILYYDTYCAHAGSMNTSDRARLAMNCKW